MKCSLAGTEKKKNHHAHTPTDTYIASEKREQKSTKNKIQINVLLQQQLPILFPCTLLSALCQCHCLSTVSHSLFILLPLFIHLFPPLPLFHNPDEKTGESALKIFRGGSWVLAEATQRDEEGRRARRERDSERQKIWSDVPLQCQQTRSSPCVKKRGLRATQNKGVTVKAAL